MHVEQLSFPDTIQRNLPASLQPKRYKDTAKSMKG